METQNESVLRKRMQGLKAVKTGVEKMAKDEDEEQPLSPWASAFRESGTDLYVIALLGSKTRVDPNYVKDSLVHSMLKNPRFSCLQVMDEKSGKMKWVKTSTNIDEHVIIPEIKQLDLNEDSSEAFLEDYISMLTKEAMDNSKPLWEFHILNLSIYGAESVGVFRIHHSLGDGFTLMSHLLATTRTVSDPEALPSFPMKKKSEITISESNYLVKLWWAAVLIWNTMVDVITLMATAFFLKDSKTPLTRVSCDGHSSRRFVVKILSLDDIKFIKNATNSTINDVILAVIQRGLCVYLNRLYGNGDDNIMNKATEKENNLPKNLRFRAIVPVSLRLPRIHGMSGEKEQNEKEMKGNNFGYVLLPMGIAIKDDPLDYIRSAKAVMARKKHSLEAIATSLIAKLLLKFFGNKGTSLLSRRIPFNTTMVFSNVPGPREEVAYLGYPISFVAPSSYGLPNGLSMHVLSYSNKVSIVLSVDENTVPNPHQLSTDLQESLKLIKDAACMP